MFFDTNSIRGSNSVGGVCDSESVGVGVDLHLRVRVRVSVRVRVARVRFAFCTLDTVLQSTFMQLLSAFSV